MTNGAGDVAAVAERLAAVKSEVAKVVVGQQEVIDQILIALLCEGHVLLEGVPGIAKTLIVRALAMAVSADFSRIQFTPDLMPSDVIGTNVFDPSTGKFSLRKGPIFTGLLLADEINRTPPKTQAALLEAMQERRVTIDGEPNPLDDIFTVFATQNPIEYEGTYPLPEAQLDRFMFHIVVDYPTADQEMQIIKQVTGTYSATLDVALTGEDILRLQEIVRRVPVADHVVQYARDLARASRPGAPEAPAFVSELVQWGAGPRAGIYMILAAKARAILHGRYHATTGDVRAVALPVMRHRVITTFNAEAAGISADEVVKRLLAEIRPAVEQAIA